MNFTKSILSIILILLLTFPGCSSRTILADTSRYQIVKEYGDYRMIFHDGGVINTNINLNIFTESMYRYFSNLADMRHAILNDTFTDTNLYVIRRHAQDSYGDVPLFDLNHLYEAVYPNDLELEHIRWAGDCYSYQIRNTNISASISVVLEEEYNESFTSRVADRNEYGTVTDTYTIDDRNATVYLYDLHNSQYKDIHYTINSGNRTLYIVETYEKQDSLVPDSLRFYGTENGIYYMGYIDNMQERPSVEWLSQFGVKEYIEPAQT